MTILVLCCLFDQMQLIWNKNQHRNTKVTKTLTQGEFKLKKKNVEFLVPLSIEATSKNTVFVVKCESDLHSLLTWALGPHRC